MSTPEEIQILRNFKAKEGAVLKLGGRSYRKLAGGRFEVVSEDIPRSERTQATPLDTKKYSSSHEQRLAEKSYETHRQRAGRAEREEDRLDTRRRASTTNQYRDPPSDLAQPPTPYVARQDFPDPSALRSAPQQRHDSNSDPYLGPNVAGTSQAGPSLPTRPPLPAVHEGNDFFDQRSSPAVDPLEHIPYGTTGPGPRTSGRDLSGSKLPERSRHVPGDYSKDFTVLQGTQKTFAGFRWNDFDGRAGYLAENPELLKSKYSNIFEEAVLRIIDNDVAAAQQCMQSVVILNLCQGLRPKHLQDEVLDMQKSDSEQKEQYEEAYRELCKSAEKLAKDQTKRLQKPNRTHSKPSRFEEPPAQPTTKPGHKKTDSKIGESSYEPVKDVAVDFSAGDIAPIRTKNLIQIEPEDFKTKEMRTLSSHYKVPLNGRKFFYPGKVFAMIFHESAGEDTRRPGSGRQGPSEEREFASRADKIDPNITIGPYGERIFSHIRRMVVIRNRDGYCWCVAINSYSGQGLKRRNLKKKEIEAHTIIHDRRYRPQRLDDEPETFKDPIAVNMVDGQNLNTASRLHYGKPYVVEWNQRVMEVGDVDSMCLATLMTDASMELLGDAARSSSTR